MYTRYVAYLVSSNTDGVVVTCVPLLNVQLADLKYTVSNSLLYNTCGTTS